MIILILFFKLKPLKGCDECLVGLNYLTCHEMKKICYDQNRNEINQEIICLTLEELNEKPRDYPLNECLPRVDHRFESTKIIGDRSYLYPFRQSFLKIQRYYPWRTAYCS